MIKQLPPELIDSVTLTQDGEGRSFYYEVKFTVFGEVMTVEDDISDLPDIAQKLILGDQKEETVSELQKGLTNLKYLVPLIAIGEVAELPHWLQPIEVALQKLQKNIPQYIKDAPLDYISSEWVKEIFIEKRSSNIYQKRISKHFVNFLLEENILLNIQRFQPYEADVATDPLLNVLANNRGDRKLSSRIIMVLGKTTNQRAYQMLTSALRDKSRTNEIRVAAAKALGKMNYERATPPLLDALWEKEHWVRVQAVKSLGNFIQEEEIVNTLISVFRNDEFHWARVRAAEALGFTKGNKKVIRILAEELKTKSDEEVLFHTVQALKRMDCKNSRFVLRNYYY